MIIDKMDDYEMYYNIQNGRSGIDAQQTTRAEVLKDTTTCKLTINPNDKILDVGCRTGLLAKEFITAGNEAYGMDIGEGAERKWKAHPNFKRADLHKKIPWRYKFDVIIMSHVIEHLYDIDICMKKIKTRMKKDTILYIKVPIDKDPTHKPHYSVFEGEKDITELADKHGFDIKLLEYRKPRIGPEYVTIFTLKENK